MVASEQEQEPLPPAEGSTSEPVDQHGAHRGWAGFIVAVLLIACLAIAPRLGWWRFSSHDVERFSVAFLATLVFALLSMHVGSQSSSASSCDERRVKAKGSRVHEQEIAEQEGDDDIDPIWEVDWTNAEQRGAAARQLSETAAPMSAEVFELNDTPTWLARLQQRRDQAQRAGKVKLVQKIDKEIAGAMKDQAISLRKDAESRSDRGQACVNGPVDSSQEDDVWSMDWTNCERSKLQTPTTA
eukprot:TRINITY_DN19998_c0_g1_i1.p1 TRINITY_DN19998_c0_g1~~TRINITY_DN19998_c0_g1_i1.p1  ORF type:complete len:242 (-),score=52.72 TRINITY_DN19998_c0_g1_i1:75-800(-)